MLVGKATTSSSEDKYGRVKVECVALWEKESTLLPVMNNIFISKGDEVVLFSPENMQQSLFILGKFQTEAVMASEPIDTKGRPVLFKAHVGSSYIIATLDEKLLHLETGKGLTVDLTAEGVVVKTPDSGVVVDVTKSEVSVKADKDVKVSSSSGKVIVNGGSNKGVVNVKDIRDLVTALAKDLLIAQSGVNLSSWMAKGMVSMEDTNFTH